MDVSFDHDASADSVFAPDAFASQVGKAVPVSILGEAVKTGRIVAAEARRTAGPCR